MDNELLQTATKLNQNHKRRAWWKKIVRTMGVLVVFCTTYALILPAITMEGETICGVEEHTHCENCYTQQTAYAWNCGLDGETKAAHTHDDLCYDDQGTLICPLPEIAAHSHDDSCYVQSETPVCDYVHIHNEDCTSVESVLICGQEETEEHTHTELCYAQQEVLCQQTTRDGHVHDDTCYHKEQICGLEALQPHTHTESCLIQTVQDVLVCGQEEHTHDDTCYPVESDGDEDSAYLCGMGAHTHVDGCYDEAGNLTCTIPEHIHSASCVVADYDKTADVETAADWEATLEDIELTGDWAVDVLAIAESQLGYQESERNVILTESGDLKGYTRYGAWYGIPYGDWCAMFVSFCLEYAQVEDVPLAANCATWIEELTEEELYRTADAYTPKPGDLIFFDWTPDDEAEGDSDHVGLVAELIAATEEEPAQIKTIEGNTTDRVDYVTYALDDPTIIGYGQLPAGNGMILTYQGEDYSVTATFDKTAGIPETAQLSVREIAQGTEEYDTYYQQAVGALMEQSDAQSQQELDVSFARFFDIHFLVDGVAVAPAAPVDIQIRYDEGFEMDNGDVGQVVHFADDGIEILDADTYSAEPVQEESVLDELTEFFTGASEKVDTFRFTQDSFSVSGTLVSTRAAITTATKVKPWEIDNTGNTMYVLYAQVGDRYYALDGNGLPVQITVDGHTLTLPGTNTSNLFWTFVDKPSNNENYKYNPVTNVGTKRYLHPFHNSSTDQGLTTSGPWDVQLILNYNNNEDLITFKIRGNNRYARLGQDGTSQPVQSVNDGTNFYVAQVGSGAGKSFNVWFDGTLGGMMSYYGAANENLPVTVGENGEAVVELPETWQSSTKYPYKLRGWYDINTHQYYAVNPDDNIQPTATITDNTVFYADWIAESYDVGQNNNHVVSSVDTSDFITTYVFDYNALFNVLSQTHTGTISATDHSETWTILNNGETVPYNGKSSLGFSFIDYDDSGEITYANNRNNINISQSGITSGILNGTTRTDLLNLLFNPDTSVIGKNYVGTGNYLFQYMDSTTENYDGEHDGYYYLDARLNAASYNQTDKRFYLYDYLERTSDSKKDGAGSAGQYSDFLPFNSPYIFGQDDDYTGTNSAAGRVDYYTDTVRRSGWEYDAKAGNDNYNSTDDAATNYFFGIRTDIEFFLPNDTNYVDDYGNHGNISTRGEHMVFDFHGDDDVWVFVDGKLLLDIGGMHGIMHGSIDFSTGTISYGADGNENTSTFQMSEGTHTMTVYYMERGSSQSNCAIYFNIAPRYDLEITKEDIYTANQLNGAKFSIYTDEACQNPAQLWTSKEAHLEDMQDDKIDKDTNAFTVVDGVAYCWGLSAGKTYYIRETTPPPGYPESDDLIRITLNNRGTATIETTSLHGSDGNATEGFAVIKQDVNDTLKIVALTFTNQKDEDTTKIRVKKVWDADATDLPNSLTVYLTVDGKQVGRKATLTEANGWTYTWTGLPKYESDGVTEIEYVVQEVQVSGFDTKYTVQKDLTDYIDWVKTDTMEDSATYILLNGGRALAYNGTSFYWTTQANAQNDKTGKDAQWAVTTNEYGFRLTNGNGYILTYTNGSFTCSTGTHNNGTHLNQVIYYLDNRLVAHANDRYFQFDTDGAAVSADGLVFSLVRKDIVSGHVVEMSNELVEIKEQTYVEVNKVWDDGGDHPGTSVTIHLLANGEDTGRTVVLSSQNDWKGTFDGLPVKDQAGTEIAYTVKEDEPDRYVASYEGEVLPGIEIVQWVKQIAFTPDSGPYRIVNGANALAVDDSGNLMIGVNDPNDESQWWKAVKQNNTIVLKHYNKKLYLRLNNNSVTLTEWLNMASAVSLQNDAITIGGKYLQMTSKTISVSQYQFNATLFTVALRTDGTGAAGTGWTVTNSIGYSLPETGGMGTTSLYTFGGLLIFGAAIMFINKLGRKRQKGGRNGRT